MDVNPRERTHGWNDPVRLAERLKELSGRDYLEAWADGDLLPPLAETLEFSISAVGDGTVDITAVPQEFHYNPYGAVHGGLVATLLDTATGCAIQSRLPAGTGYVTLALTTSFLRPVTRESGPLCARGNVVSLGRRVAVAEGIVRDASNREVARGTANCLVLLPT
jgi:uncharacterized protein (TIGR00369 family)